MEALAELAASDDNDDDAAGIPDADKQASVSTAHAANAGMYHRSSLELMISNISSFSTPRYFGNVLSFVLVGF